MPIFYRSAVWNLNFWYGASFDCENLDFLLWISRNCVIFFFFFLYSKILISFFLCALYHSHCLIKCASSRSFIISQSSFCPLHSLPFLSSSCIASSPLAASSTWPKQFWNRSEHTNLENILWFFYITRTELNSKQVIQFQDLLKRMDMFYKV